jgi:hypothetical protein
VPLFGDIGDRERAWHARAAAKLMTELADVIGDARADGEALVLQVGEDRAIVTVDLTGILPTFRIATTTTAADAITIDGAVVTGDPGRIALWTDDVVRAAPADGARLAIGDGAVIASPRTRDLQHLARVVVAAAALATRPQRIARASDGPYR